MGEIADAMLDGVLCQACGCYMGDGQGFPGFCSPECAGEDRYAPRVPRFSRYNVKPSKPRADQVACPVCARVVKKVGLPQHMLDKHPSPAADARDAEGGGA